MKLHLAKLIKVSQLIVILLCCFCKTAHLGFLPAQTQADTREGFDHASWHACMLIRFLFPGFRSHTHPLTTVPNCISSISDWELAAGSRGASECVMNPHWADSTPQFGLMCMWEGDRMMLLKLAQNCGIDFSSGLFSQTSLSPRFISILLSIGKLMA